MLLWQKGTGNLALVVEPVLHLVPMTTDRDDDAVDDECHALEAAPHGLVAGVRLCLGGGAEQLGRQNVLEVRF
jgi:hypothetical protein